MSAQEYLATGSAPKQSKYRAKPVVIDGIRFDSTREGQRYTELKHLERAGEITDLELQPVLPLIVNGVTVAQYRADFRYRNADGRTVTEDVKGVRTDVYKLKKRMVQAIYGIEITEVE